MQVYLVRHGETLYNRHYTHQHPGVSLSEKGRREAEAVGIALRGVPTPLLLTSDLARSQETADIIGSTLGVTSEAGPLFREMKRPTQVVNTSYYGFYSLTVGLQLLIHSAYASWHYSDEENLHDIRRRVDEALAQLASLSHEHKEIIVVSHAVFITLILTKLRHGGISFFAYLIALLKFTQVANASITLISYEPHGEGGAWRIESVNDRSHLKGIA